MVITANNGDTLVCAATEAEGIALVHSVMGWIPAGLEEVRYKDQWYHARLSESEYESLKTAYNLCQLWLAYS